MRKGNTKADILCVLRFKMALSFFFLQTKAQTASASHLHVVLSTSLTPTQIIFNIAPSAFIHPDN